MKVAHSQPNEDTVKIKNELKFKHRDDKQMGGFDVETKMD